MYRRPVAGVLLLSALFAGYGLWAGAGLTLTLAATFLLLAGIGCAVYGTLGLVDPRTVARLSEQVDAIGSTTPLAEVEPQGWTVSVTRVQAGAIALIGLCNLGMALLFVALVS